MTAFDEAWFNNNCRYRKFPHFHSRAFWVHKNLNGSIVELGCSYGFMLEELKDTFSTVITGCDISQYAVSWVREDIRSQIQLCSAANLDGYFDWAISWNTLDCLSEGVARSVADHLNSISAHQLHMLCMSGQNYVEQGFFIRDIVFWRELFPNAVLVCSECCKVYDPVGYGFNRIPLHHGKVSD